MKCPECGSTDCNPFLEVPCPRCCKEESVIETSECTLCEGEGFVLLPAEFILGPLAKDVLLAKEEERQAKLAEEEKNLN